jgi:hypothetical protein
MEDQEAIAAGEQTVSVVTTPPFSSPDPETDALKMEIVDADVTAYQAREEMAAAPLVTATVGTPTDVADFKAADFKARVEAATTQEELDAAAELYANSGKEFATVEAAVEKKQSEIDEAESSGDGS